MLENYTSVAQLCSDYVCLVSASEVKCRLTFIKAKMKAQLLPCAGKNKLMLQR